MLSTFGDTFTYEDVEESGDAVALLWLADDNADTVMLEDTEEVGEDACWDGARLLLERLPHFFLPTCSERFACEDEKGSGDPFALLTLADDAAGTVTLEETEEVGDTKPGAQCVC